MTTTAATTSASPSTSNDSPPMQNDIAASETTTPITLDRQRQNQQDNSERSLSSSPQPPPPSSPLPTTQPPQSPQQQNQSPPPQPNNIDQTSTPPNAATTTITTTTTTTTTTTITTLSLSSSASSSPTTSTTTLATPAITSVSTAAINKELQQSPSSQQSQSTNNSSSNNNTEQKRPMNAFLLFCKRQRSLVREKYPNLENRGITKILGDWWSKLDKEQKSKYTDLARQHKEAFMKANPDFKWCKTPNVSNINNNNSSNNNSSNSNDCYANNSPNNHHHQLQQQQQQHQHLNKNQQNHNNSTTTTNAELLSLQSVQHHLDGLHHSSNSMDFTLTSRQQLEAPKPPKKRFLERNDSIYTTRNNFSSNHESNSHSADVVPYISLDQDTLDRVIDKAFSEDSNNSPSGTNTCKCSNRTSTNLTSSLGSTNQASSSSSSSSSAYTAMSVDEPIDFSTNRTINTTRQQIINNLVEKMLSDPTDNASSFSKINGTYSVKSQTGPPVKKDNPDET